MTPLRIFALAAVSVLLVTGRAEARPFPETIALPNGFQPEGIAVGKGHTFYVGSIPTGAIYRGDLRTGAGTVLPLSESDRMAAGIKVDNRNRIFVAGAFTGQACTTRSLALRSPSTNSGRQARRSSTTSC